MVTRITWVSSWRYMAFPTRRSLVKRATRKFLSIRICAHRSTSATMISYSTGITARAQVWTKRAAPSPGTGITHLSRAQSRPTSMETELGGLRVHARLSHPSNSLSIKTNWIEECMLFQLWLLTMNFPKIKDSIRGLSKCKHHSEINSSKLSTEQRKKREPSVTITMHCRNCLLNTAETLTTQTCQYPRWIRARCLDRCSEALMGRRWCSHRR